MFEFNELISIITPVFNSELYLEETIISVIKQSYTNWELILIDDGSTDNSFNIMKSMEKKDNRIKVFKNDNNLGVSNTRNRGIEISEGKWIAFLDSDDSWDHLKLEKQIKVIESKECCFVFTGSKYINEKGIPFKGIMNVPDKINYKQLRKHNVISCSSVLVTKDVFNNIKMENDDMSEDFAVWLKILQKDIIAYGVDEPLLIYRISRNSKSGNKLKTFQMAYKVYRFIGINPISSTYYTLNHLVASIFKYKKIYLTK